MKKQEIGIIGLGKFGMELGVSLMRNGHRVIGLDNDDTVVQNAQDALSVVYKGDATDKTLLDQLRFQDMDCVALSVGSSMDTSIIAALNLHDLKVRNILAKAISRQHMEVLRRLGVHQVIQPEADVARLTAMRLSNPGMLDFVDVDGGVLLQQASVSAWAGKTLTELSLTTEHQVMVVAIKKAGQSDFRFVPDPRIPMEKGDLLMMVGGKEAVLALKP
ncbi:MAG: TrkA family potassium uptake protein [Deltaproteobacteria bacterium]|jgi:trk system potassium uptake protein TrkA|nr:TrkA family potassium uptake protein [Deltaproteobacteria bacterium]